MIATEAITTSPPDTPAVTAGQAMLITLFTTFLVTLLVATCWAIHSKIGLRCLKRSNKIGELPISWPRPLPGTIKRDQKTSEWIPTATFTGSNPTVNVNVAQDYIAPPRKFVLTNASPITPHLPTIPPPPYRSPKLPPGAKGILRYSVSSNSAHSPGKSKHQRQSKHSKRYQRTTTSTIYSTVESYLVPPRRERGHSPASSDVAASEIGGRYVDLDEI